MALASSRKHQRAIGEVVRCELTIAAGNLAAIEAQAALLAETPGGPFAFAKSRQEGCFNDRGIRI